MPEEQRKIGEQALEQVLRTFTEAEKTLSRFNRESELSRMNAFAGRPFKASPLLFEVVIASINAARATDGLFDPTILHDLLVAGYDRSFDELAGRHNDSQGLFTRHRYSWRDVRLDTRLLTIKMPEGCGLDLGGIGKGWTVDRACDGLRAFPGYALDAGGDIRVEGTRAGGSSWTIGVADPFKQEHDLLVLELSQGAVCTSTTVRRRW